jgi:hypothetical protein
MKYRIRFVEVCVCEREGVSGKGGVDERALAPFSPGCFPTAASKTKQYGGGWVWGGGELTMNEHLPLSLPGRFLTASFKHKTKRGHDSHRGTAWNFSMHDEPFDVNRDL